MIIDKSKDHLLQNSVRTIWYLRKVADGDATFNTASEATFKAATGTKQVGYVVKEDTDRSSPNMLQNEQSVYHVFRTPWTAVFNDLPCISDKLFADGEFWLVKEVRYTDMDDSGLHQRFVLTCTSSKRTPTT